MCRKRAFRLPNREEPSKEAQKKGQAKQSLTMHNTEGCTFCHGLDAGWIHDRLCHKYAVFCILIGICHRHGTKEKSDSRKKRSQSGGRGSSRSDVNDGVLLLYEKVQTVDIQPYVVLIVQTVSDSCLCGIFAYLH